MCDNSVRGEDAYRLLLVHNFLSSVAVANDGNGLEGHRCCSDSSEGKYKEKKSGCHAEFALSSATTALLSLSGSSPKPVRQAGRYRIGNGDHNNERMSVDLDKVNREFSEATEEISVRASKKSPGKFGIIIASTESKEEDEENEEETGNHQSFFKLYHIRNRRYFLVSHEARIPVIAFSHLPYSRERLTHCSSQSEDPYRSGIISSEYAAMRPINYKQIPELSFRDVFSANTDSTSSEDDSPLMNRKRLSGDDRSSIAILSSPHSRSHRLSRTGTAEEVPLLLNPLYGSSSSTYLIEYDPYLINNFDPDCGARKTVMKFTGYISTTVHYQPDNDVKRLVNEAFRSRFPQVHVSFSKINSIKRELHRIAVACNLEDCTTAHAYVFYEKVLLKGLVCKMNRKLVAGAALLIAAKITDFGSMRTSDVVNCLESSLRISRKELLRYEIPLCAALNFNLKVPVWQLLPHYQRIALAIL